jgi:hypothetical protein
VSKKLEKQKINSLKKFVVGIYRFFVPKNFGEELLKGRIIGEQIRQGKISPKVVPTWWLGKAIRKLIDPKHKMKIGEKRDNGKT